MKFALFTIRACSLCFVSIRQSGLMCIDYFDEIFEKWSFPGRYVPNMMDCRRKRIQYCFSAQLLDEMLDEILNYLNFIQNIIQYFFSSNIMQH